MHHFNPQNMASLAKYDAYYRPITKVTMIDSVILTLIFEGWVEQDEAKDERNIKLWLRDLNLLNSTRPTSTTRSRPTRNA